MPVSIFASFTKQYAKFLPYSLVTTSPDFRSGPYFINEVRLTVLSILSPGPGFIYLSPDPDIIKLVRARILSILSPSPDCIKIVRKASPGPDFMNFWVRVRVLSI